MSELREKTKTITAGTVFTDAVEIYVGPGSSGVAHLMLDGSGSATVAATAVFQFRAGSVGTFVDVKTLPVTQTTPTTQQTIEVGVSGEGRIGVKASNFTSGTILSGVFQGGRRIF